MIDYINAQRTEHIITIEDPIEFLHRDKKSIVNQREVEVDTRSFAAALRSALRQDPDVILVGEMRDYETIETAITAAETGHLVLSTLHTLDATETDQPHHLRVPAPPAEADPPAALGRARRPSSPCASCPRADGHGRVPAVEVMIATPFIRDCIINKDKTKLIHEAIAAGVSQYGMQTFDQSIFQLYKKELITYDEALRRASEPGRVQAEDPGHPVHLRHGRRGDGEDDAVLRHGVGAPRPEPSPGHRAAHGVLGRLRPLPGRLSGGGHRRGPCPLREGPSRRRTRRGATNGGARPRDVAADRPCVRRSDRLLPSLPRGQGAGHRAHRPLWRFVHPRRRGGRRAGLPGPPGAAARRGRRPGGGPQLRHALARVPPELHALGPRVPALRPRLRGPGPGRVPAERDTTFQHAEDREPGYLHARYVLDGSGVRLVEVAGTTTTRAPRPVPPSRSALGLSRYDRRAPAALRALVPAGYEVRNPFFYYRGSWEAEAHGMSSAADRHRGAVGRAGVAAASAAGHRRPGERAQPSQRHGLAAPPGVPVSPPRAAGTPSAPWATRSWPSRWRSR